MKSTPPTLASLTGDYRYQADFVVDASWRLLAMQDAHPASPAFGCFHYAYWRDKTSEFPDARFQEAGATLAILALPFFDEARRAGRLAPPDVLTRGFSAALLNLSRQQYAEGTFDEWYKGERGFAATEFTTIAYGFAARCLGERLDAADRDRLAQVMTRAAGWLSGRGDRIKANHHAAAAAALALAAEVTGDASFTRAAHLKIDEVLARQHAEGWFPEVGGMDLGYCSVLLDYVMVYTHVTGDARAVPAMRRLLAFMLPLLHPDGTISPEMGICLNPYVSRLGIGLLSTLDPDAAALVAFFKSASGGLDVLRPYLADDLRLARWSHLPLVTGLLLEGFNAGAGSAPTLEARFPEGWTWRDAAGVGAFHEGRTHVYVSAAGGGAVRVYRGAELAGEDLGLDINAPGGRAISTGYDPARPVERTPRGVSVACRLGMASFMQPGFLSRLALRIGSSSRLGSRVMRALVDYVRVKTRTAANQSSAPVARGDSPYRLARAVEIDGPTVRIVDRVTNERGVVDPAHVRTHSERRPFTAASPLPAAAPDIMLVKSCQVEE